MEVWSKEEVLSSLKDAELALARLYSLRKEWRDSEDKDMKFLIEKNIALDFEGIRWLRNQLTG